MRQGKLTDWEIKQVIKKRQDKFRNLTEKKEKRKALLEY